MFDNIFSFYVTEPCWFMAKDIWQYTLIALLTCAVGAILLRLSGRGCVGLAFIGFSIDLFLQNAYSEEIPINIILLIYGLSLFVFATVQKRLKKDKTPLGERCLTGIISLVISTLLVAPLLYYNQGLTMSAYRGVNFIVIRTGGIIMAAGIILSIVFNILHIIRPFKKPLLPLILGNAVFLAGYFILTFTGIPSLWDRIFSFLIVCSMAAFVVFDIKKYIRRKAEN